MTRTVLVLDGASGPALAATRSLGRAGWRVLVPAGSRSARSRFAAAEVALPEAADDVEAFSRGVVEVVHEHGVDVVAPATDASVQTLWDVADDLGDARILGADRETAQLALDKAQILAAADEHGFPAPAWRAPADLGEAEAAVAEVGAPAVLKARRSYRREGARLIQRRHAFVQSASEVAAALPPILGDDGELPVVQSFVPGRSLSVSAVLRDGRVLALAARETLSFDPIVGGTSVWKRTVAPDDVGVQEAIAFMRALGYEGIGEVEYQVGTDGVPRLMEVGVRLHGWVPLALHAGVDLTLVAARALLGDELPERTGYRVGAEMRWPAGEIGRLRAVARRDAGLPPGMRRRDVIAKAWPPWRPGMAYDGIDLSDPGPWLRRRAQR
jgi:biotin carboxylase